MDVEALGDVGANGAEDAFGFEGLTAFDDAGERFVGADLEDFLRDDGAFVEVGGDEMGRDPDDLDAALVGLAIGVGAGEGGEQRGVDVDNFIFPAPDEVGREDFHEAGEDDEIDFVLLEDFQDFLLGRGAVVEGDVVEGKFLGLGERRQIGAAADDDDRLCAERLGGFREESFEDVGFLRDQDSEALGAGRGEMDFRFHAEIAPGFADALLDLDAVEAGGRP